MRQVRTPSKSNVKLNPAEKGNPHYVGITSQESGRVVGQKDDKENKNKKIMEKEKKKKNRKIEDGLLLVVPARIYGKEVKTLIDSRHEVDLVLGINWLQLVNLVVYWGGACLYAPNAVQTALL